jgi:hypothetical protein
MTMIECGSGGGLDATYKVAKTPGSIYLTSNHQGIDKVTNQLIPVGIITCTDRYGDKDVCLVALLCQKQLKDRQQCDVNSAVMSFTESVYPLVLLGVQFQFDNITSETKFAWTLKIGRQLQISVISQLLLPIRPIQG